MNDEQRRRAGRMVAIPSDKDSDSKKVFDNLNLRFDMLSDNELKTIRTYGVFFHEPHVNIDCALPTHFLIDKDGVIRWRYISPRSNDRHDPQTVISEIAKL